MDDVVRHEWLEGIRREHGDGTGGKILQRLLELAFHDLGYRLVEERMSEGIDFDVQHRQRSDDRYSFEARTSAAALVPVKDEDLRQMDERAREGYRPGLAALHIRAGSRWVLVERSWLLPPSLRISVGSSALWEKLAREVNDAFDDVLKRLGERAVREGLDGLKSYVDQAMV